MELMPMTCTVWKASKETKALYDTFIKDRGQKVDLMGSMLQVAKDSLSELGRA